MLREERVLDLQAEVLAIEVPKELLDLVERGVGVTRVSWVKRDGSSGVYPPLSEHRSQIVNGADPTKG